MKDKQGTCKFCILCTTSKALEILYSGQCSMNTEFSSAVLVFYINMPILSILYWLATIVAFFFFIILLYLVFEIWCLVIL